MLPLRFKRTIPASGQDTLAPMGLMELMGIPYCQEVAYLPVDLVLMGTFTLITIRLKQFMALNQPVHGAQEQA